MAVEPQMQRRWEEQLAGYVTASFRVTNLGNVASQGVQLVSKLATALTLYFGARLVIEGSLSVGELVAFNMLSGRVSQPVLRLAQIWQDFHQARLSVARLGDILNTPAEQTYNASRSTLPAVIGSVRFEHVTFRYRVDGSEVLHDIDFDVPAGQIVGIVGPSGSGKSTVAKLVQRLYVPESGKVLVDGIDLAWSIRPGCDDKSAWCCRRTSFSTPRFVRTLRWLIRPCRWKRSLRPQPLLAPTISSWSCQKAMTRLWASAATVCPEASASESRLRARW